MAFKIKLKRGTKANLPTLSDGEPAFTTDEKELYIGSSSSGNVKLTRNSEVDQLKSSSHTHSNKSVIDTITSALISNWNSAYSHISDAVKHITASERTLWNTVSNKSDKGHTHDDRYYTESEADSKFATKSEITSAGYGDMLKSVYDTNGDGIVDKAASVDWSGITSKPSTYTPSSHTHNYAGSSSAGGAATSALTCTGNSATATKLATARTINGTSFDGSANITITAAANGGTSAACSGNSATATKLATGRGLTIGNTKKTFDGSADVSWSLSEIGAATSSHTHNYAGSSSAGGAATTALACTGNAATATKLATARTINGTSFNGSANITTANWGTARTLRVGNAGKSVNGSGNVSWSLVEMGALGKQGEITASTDWNALRTLGIYKVQMSAWGATSLGGPNNFSSSMYSYGMLVIYQSNVANEERTIQVYYPHKTDYSQPVLTRMYNGSAWNAWTKIGRGITASDVGLGNVNNTADSAKQVLSASKLTTARTINGVSFDGSANITITAAANGGTSAACSGNAATATKLQTARTINGTSFNGSANITTANWGTARTLTVGNTGKSVNGSGNVSWSLAEIGAAASSHTHNYAGSSSAGGAATTALACTGNSATATTSNYLASNTRMDYNWNGMNYFNISGTAGTAAKANNTPTTAWWHIMRFNHANSSGYYTDLAVPFNDTSLYYKRVTSGAVQNGGWVKVLDSLNYNSYAPTKTGTGASGTWGISVTGNSATATKLQTARTINGTSFNGSTNITTANWGTARTITIGNAGKSVNGSGNVSWSLAEIGASRAHSSSYSFGGNQNAITTAQFISLISAQGAFSQPHWVSRGSWSYASNQYINDTGCGNIHLAGCVVEVFGNSSNYTIRITTPTTSSSGVSHGDFIYVNNGSSYSPGWRRLYSTHYPQTTITGNAGTATKLQTARTINGTSFNGSANITTANWGTARTITIGNAGKSVNGSGNVSWSLAEIGAMKAGPVTWNNLKGV